jgi:hypothetical protein
LGLLSFERQERPPFYKYGASWALTAAHPIETDSRQMDFIVIAALAWVAVDLLVLGGALALARRRARRYRRSVDALVERAERHANRVPYLTEPPAWARRA